MLEDRASSLLGVSHWLKFHNIIVATVYRSLYDHFAPNADSSLPVLTVLDALSTLTSAMLCTRDMKSLLRLSIAARGIEIDSSASPRQCLVQSDP